MSGADLVLIGHGSRDGAAAREFDELRAMVAARIPERRLAGGFLELADPPIDEAVDKLVAEGTTDVVAVPYVLFGAGHLKDDGPAVLGRARRRHPDVRFRLGRDLGIHPAVLDVAEDRARATLAELPPGDDTPAVVLVGRGSTDPDACADFVKFARLLGDGRGLGPVEPAFVAMTTPSIEDALDRVHTLGHRRIAVVPLFLFSGVLVDRIAQRATAWAAARTNDTEAETAAAGTAIAEIVADTRSTDTETAAGIAMAETGAVARVAETETDADTDAGIAMADVDADAGIAMAETGVVARVAGAVARVAETDAGTATGETDADADAGIAVAGSGADARLTEGRTIEIEAATQTSDVEAGGRAAGVALGLAGPLGADPRLADLIVERFAEAEHGDVRMNCDVCSYRVRLPGFEERLGTPLSLAPPEKAPRGWRARRAANQAASEAGERRERPRRGLGRRTGIPPAPDTDGPVIEVRGLTHRWPDGTDALSGTDLVVESRERIAVLGPNGSGKSTLALHLVGGHADGRDGVISTGTVTVAGHRVDRANLATIRRLVGLVFQDPDDQILLPTVAADVGLAPRNHGLAADEVDQRVAAALDVVGLTDAADRAPGHLSLGERRRVALAGVLAAHPQVLVLDEPTANLDPAARRDLIEVIRGLDLTTLVITHDLPLALELCPRSVVLAHGRVAAEGPTETLFANPTLLAAHRLELPYRLSLG